LAKTRLNLVNGGGDVEFEDVFYEPLINQRK